MARFVLFLSLLSFALISLVNCRVSSSVSEENTILSSEILSLDPPKRISKDACIHVYGFLPCADNIGGYVFQVFSFGCLLILGEYFLTEGRSKLFVIFEVGFYGGIIFPLLTMFPRIALILSTALTGDREMVNLMVGSNVGVTVGYTVFALTMQWGACVVFGLSGLRSDRSLLKNIAKASVKADPKNKKPAGLMLLSLLPFVMVTSSGIFVSKSWSDFIVLITLVISSSATVVYFVYSYFDIAHQQKSLDHTSFEAMSEVHKHLQIFSPENLIRNGQLSEESLHSLFKKIDRSNDGKIQVKELNDLTMEFGMLGRVKCDLHELVNTLITEFDSDKDGEIDETGFKNGVTKWLKRYKFTFDDTESHILLSKRTLRAVSEVIVGILIVLYLARPFMMNIENLSVSAGVPSFYIMFAVIPLARNLKNALSGHFCHKKDKARVTSDIFSGIYKDVTMNNLMGISIILATVYVRGLTWDYSTEVLIILIVGLLIGVPAYVRSTYPFWICVLAFALYFFSLVLVYVHFKPLDKSETFTSIK